MSFSTIHDIASQVSPVHASDNDSLTAGGAGDNTQVVGQIVDRLAYNFPLSVAGVITAKAVLGASKTLTLKSVILETGDDPALADAATLYSPADVVIFTDSGSGSTLRGQQKYYWDLAGAKRYIRIKYTPDLSALNTDTAECASIFVFGGEAEVPAA